MATVTIQYWAAAREAAGVELESVEASTLAEALDVIVARRGDGSRLRAVLAASSFLVDGAAASRGAAPDVVLPDAAVIEVLPQFAGGLSTPALPSFRTTQLGIPAVLRHTGLITPYGVRVVTFRSHIAVPHEPARTPSRPPDTRGSARRHESPWAFEPPGAARRSY
jgi:molybdopterin converting factor small subunit